MNSFRVRLFGATVTLCFACGIPLAAADSMPLSTLLAGATITEGDKIFSNFSAPLCITSTTPCAYGDLVLTVVGTTDASGNFGIRFEWLEGDISKPISFANAEPLETGPFCPSLCSFGVDYTVSVLKPGLSITDANLASDMLLTGGCCDGSTSGSALVQQTFKPASPLPLSVGEDISLEPTLSDTVSPSTSGTLEPVSLLQVQTQILLSPSAGGGSLSFIDETFSQSPTPPPGGSVPEPDSLALMTFGLAATLWFWRQREAHATS